MATAPKANVGVEDEGPASRTVNVRTVDEGERQKALKTRQSALKKAGTLIDPIFQRSEPIDPIDVDLGEIARSSAAVSSSPPTNVSLEHTSVL